MENHSCPLARLPVELHTSIITHLTPKALEACLEASPIFRDGLREGPAPRILFNMAKALFTDEDELNLALAVVTFPVLDTSRRLKRSQWKKDQEKIKAHFLRLKKGEWHSDEIHWKALFRLHHITTVFAHDYARRALGMHEGEVYDLDPLLHEMGIEPDSSWAASPELSPTTEQLVRRAGIRRSFLMYEFLSKAFVGSRVSMSPREYYTRTWAPFDQDDLTLSVLTEDEWKGVSLSIDYARLVETSRVFIPLVRLDKLGRDSDGEAPIDPVYVCKMAQGEDVTVRRFVNRGPVALYDRLLASKRPVDTLPPSADNWGIGPAFFSDDRQQREGLRFEHWYKVREEDEAHEPVDFQDRARAQRDWIDGYHPFSALLARHYEARDNIATVRSVALEDMETEWCWWNSFANPYSEPFFWPTERDEGPDSPWRGSQTSFLIRPPRRWVYWPGEPITAEFKAELEAFADLEVGVDI